MVAMHRWRCGSESGVWRNCAVDRTCESQSLGSRGPDPRLREVLICGTEGHIIRVSAHQLAVAVARVTEGFAGTPNDSAVLISNDSIAVFEAGFVTNDLVVPVAYELGFEHFEPLLNYSWPQGAQKWSNTRTVRFL